MCGPRDLDKVRGETQGENYGYHGSAPFFVVLRLPEQDKDIRDRHHVLKLFRKEKATKLLVA